MVAAIALEHVALLDVSAASGMAFDAGVLVVVADDRLFLTRYTTAGRPLHVTRLFAGELPDDPVERKHAKPDLEALVRLRDGGLLALPSGSKKRGRSRGAWVVGERVVEVDCAPLFAELARSTSRLNVEGASVLGDSLVLLTRRTGRKGDNRLIRLRLHDTLAALERDAPQLDASLIEDIVSVEVGEIDGVPLGLTDATTMPDGTLLFSAAAETTDDPVFDGPIAAAVLGRMDRDGRVLGVRVVTPLVKIEGIAVADDGFVYAVGDADDPTVMSPLVRLPIGAPDGL